ncbi:DHA2 family efflux MFS transporter permease subunit [Lentilactobacillus hilgardii]|uniref:DHA2 family efflux MFS transporter permease subunit n=1 Tax=Lentilactobacillus hilgardii TaxID=1588 RepID=UPI00019C5618|nr:DHA2 family efflux MFS transporter permease subunit [Lentilactobacillus hilgardii]EEI70966.1 drug resistance MFS transporter, drug:H+ antiporter-2 family [Lentilactobacillus hilgardii ATCC 27305]
MNESMIKEKKEPSIATIGIVLVLGAIVPMLDTTMTNVGINTILKDLSSTVNVMQWVATAYVLALGLAVPLAGWLLDQVSGRLLQEVSLIIFMIGSLVSGTANSIPALIIGRIIQGAGAGVIITGMSALAIRAAHGQNLGKLMSVIGLPIVFAPILGPTVGGALIKYLNWHWLFYINIPFVVAALIATFALLPKFTPSAKGKAFDFLGFLLITGTFSGIVIGITNYSADNIFGKLSVLLPVFLGIDCLLVYIIYAFKQPNKVLVPLGLFSSANFSASTALLFLSGLMINGVMFVLPLYLQNIRHLSVIWVGIYLIAQGVGMLATRSITGTLTDKYGARWIVITSMVGAAITTLPFAFFTAKTSEWLVLFVLFLMGLTRSGITIPVMSDAYTGLDPKLIPQATVATRMAQNIGGSIATAVLAGVIQSIVGNNVAADVTLNNAYQTAFIWTSIGTLLGVIPAMFLSNRIGKKAN